MRIGLQVNKFTWDGGPAEIGTTFGRIARDADQAGLSSFWVMDHFFQIFGGSELEMLEAYTALGYAAALTERITLGTLVTGVTYRHPGLLIKTVTTLDVLSGGRAWLGIGTAWHEEEHRGLGVPYPPTAERFERLEETLQIAHRMWDGDESPFEGRYYQLERPLNSPPALNRPKILIGGGGEKKTLRLLARYGDACNLFDGPDPAVIPHKLAVLRGHCEATGRDYAQIHKTVLSNLFLTRDGADGRSETPAQAIERLSKLAALGVDEVIVNSRVVSQPRVFDLFAEVAEGLAGVVPAGR
ncbi:LLM class F420-dependent oxidoreductase [Kineosporia sp. NBRC 101731]|uniref:LLM class F420-dependent oxidoreductase n=1 Tax=Kineosporia sp. NBRC 101731 TaxID=3032199 RepID=UPI0024A38BBB|nr:LLM class F420-dependent oxidoreductase [Kineosporia sp. NBRC 101731]GLY28736.1 LLM class F420-dependent oxidoreductase [Kineosporia sp. NBRC 101731]